MAREVNDEVLNASSEDTEVCFIARSRKSPLEMPEAHICGIANCNQKISR